ncbi:MAG: holo-ACP synthase [Acidimicrobiales bacterium]
MGVDAVDVERFRRLLIRRPGLAQRIFTEAERAYVSARIDPVPGLAARFAAKEATMKALGSGLGGMRFAEVEVLGAKSGAPKLEVYGLAARRAEALGVRSWHVSLTHTDSLAAAVVVAV